MSENTDGNAIAIIGMAGRFPKSPDIATYWRNLRDGVDCITHFTSDDLLAAGVPSNVLRNPSYVRARGIIDDEDGFDATLFGMGAHEAERTDPQQRMWLECALAALEDAGCNPHSYKGLIGVFAGVGSPDYLLRWPAPGGDPLTSYQLIIGNDKDFVATRTAYKLGLRGPCLSVQTACSSSLVAVALACQQLLSFQCDIALAGGASLSVPTRVGYWYREGMILSPDGKCRAFDARAQGTVPADGVGAVVLKRLAEALSDGDDIHAVIHGVAINNDGDSKVGFTAPSVGGQVDAITQALAYSGLSARDVTLLEAHGTGTALGDPIEFSALNQVFRDAGTPRGHCTIGSAKSYIGHLNIAAGIAGLIKAVLSIKHRMLPAMLHFEKPNPEIPLGDSPFQINRELRPWDAAGPLIAGVSSFGIGGTNAHVVVGQAPERGPIPPSSARLQVLPLSAATPHTVRRLASDLANALERQPLPLPSVAHTLQTGRIERRHRQVVIARDLADALRKLRDQASPSTVPETPAAFGFLFPGQGSQYPGMGMSLAREVPAIREELERADAVLRQETGIQLLRTLQERQAIEQTAVLQPILFAVEYATAVALLRWGIVPAGLLGHSLGEYVAACLSGVFSLPQALVLVAERGRLMQDTPPGAMLSVPLGEAEARPLLAGALDLAAVNSASQCVVSGSVEAITQLSETLQARGLEGRRLRTSNAFHSRLMDPILDRFLRAVSRVRMQSGTIPFLSCLTGDWLPAHDAMQPEYWVRQLRSTVRFDQALGRLLQRTSWLVEAGPGETLSAMARRHSERPDPLHVLPTLGRASEEASEADRTLGIAAAAWSAGVPILWSALRESLSERGDRSIPLPRVHLPTYPFERKKFWGARGLTGYYPSQVSGSFSQTGRIQLPRATFSGTLAGRRTRMTLHGQPILDPKNALPAAAPETTLPRPQGPPGWLYVPAWRPAPSSAKAKPVRRWLVFADAAGFGQRIAERLGDSCIVVTAADRFAARGDRRFEVNPSSLSDLSALLAALRSDPPDGIVHTLSVAPPASSNRTEAALGSGYFSVTALVQALTTAGLSAVQLNVVTVGATAARGKPSSPISALLCGLGKVLPFEYPELGFRQIDLAIQELQTEDLRRLLLTELTLAMSAPLVALRAGERLVCTYEPLGESPPPPLPIVQPGGVYLITGGLGGIGLTLAEHLAATYGARLILTGRSGTPPEKDWPHILSLPRQDEARLRLEKYLRIRAQAGGLLVQPADVSDPAQTRMLVDLAQSRYGTLDGVIHSAGVASGGLLHQRTREESLAILAAKVQGTLALESALRGVPIDFLLLCSSLTAMLGGLGQADYAAANAFLDAYAASNNGEEGRLVLSINWDGWREVGAAARHATKKKESERLSVLRHPLLAGWEQTPRGGAYRTPLASYRGLLAPGHEPSQQDLPLTVQLELACALTQAHGLGFPFTLDSLQLGTPCHVDNREPPILYSFVQESNGELSIQIASEDAQGTWRTHVTLRAKPAGSAEAAAPSAWPSLLPPPLGPDALDPLRASLAVLSDGIESVPVSPNQTSGSELGSPSDEHGPACAASAHFRLPAAADAARFVLHPALLEAAVQLLVACRGSQGQLIAMQSLTVFSPLGSDILAVAAADSADGPGTGQIWLTSPSGQPLARVDGLCLRHHSAPEGV